MVYYLRDPRSGPETVCSLLAARPACTAGPLLFLPGKSYHLEKEGMENMATVVLDYAVPSCDLADYVTLFYRFEADAPRFDEIERADHAQFRFCLTPGQRSYRLHDGRTLAAPAIHILPATNGATRSIAEGPLRLFGLGLTPAGWSALKLDASCPSHGVLDAGALLGAPMAALHAALTEAGTLAEMLALAEPVLRPMLAGASPELLRFVGAVDGWLMQGGPPDLDALGAATGLSRRQLERRCNRLYGAPPKLLARKYRALRAAAALATQGAGVDPATLADFYDQSHMIREIKQFAGVTPRRMRDDPGLLAMLTIRQRRALAGRVGPLVSDT